MLRSAAAAAATIFSRATSSVRQPAPSAAFALVTSRVKSAVHVPLEEEQGGTITFPREGAGFSSGLNWALAGRGVIVKDKAFYNLQASELQKGGAVKVENLTRVPLYMRGSVVGAASEVTKAQFGKLLKQATFHLSSVSTLYVQDGSVGSSSDCDTKVRVISDNASSIISLTDILWEVPSRAISHDSCPLTVYATSSISPSAYEFLGAKSHSSVGLAAADIERSSLILCGKSFADSSTIRAALSALATPILSARGGLPIYGRLLLFGKSVVLLFAPDEVVNNCAEIQKSLVSTDGGVVVFSHGSNVLFRAKAAASRLYNKPACVILVSSDSTGVLPPLAKLSPGQAAYHFLAGYQDGKFVSAYNKGPSSVTPLSLANSIYSLLQESNTPTFRINVKVAGTGKYITGQEFVRLVESALYNKIPESQSQAANGIVADLKGKFTTFLSGKYPEIPKEFSF